MKNFLDKLYENVGGKVRVVAKVIGVVGCLAMVVGLVWAIGAMVTGEDWAVPIALGILGGGFVFLVSSWPIYGFGQMIDDVNNIRNK